MYAIRSYYEVAIGQIEPGQTHLASIQVQGQQQGIAPVVEQGGVGKRARGA